LDPLGGTTLFSLTKGVDPINSKLLLHLDLGFSAMRDLVVMIQSKLENREVGRL